MPKMQYPVVERVEVAARESRHLPLLAAIAASRPFIRPQPVQAPA